MSPTNLRLLANLIEKYQHHRLQVYEIDYRRYSMGSWAISMGNEKALFSFIWDGKERWLQIARKVLTHRAEADPWIENPVERLAKADDAFVRMAAYVSQILDAD